MSQKIRKGSFSAGRGYTLSEEEGRKSIWKQSRKESPPTGRNAARMSQSSGRRSWKASWPGCGSLRSVSYTHLDVYKRQEVYRYGDAGILDREAIWEVYGVHGEVVSAGNQKVVIVDE